MLKVYKLENEYEDHMKKPHVKKNDEEDFDETLSDEDEDRPIS
jgi:hypothetical protein